MIIVCDSGSTKADWQFIDANKAVKTITTMGFNPVFHSSEKMVSELKIDLVPRMDCPSVSEIYFYGAGCWNEDLKNVIKEGLTEIFPNAYIEVEHDLLGAARATCGSKAGIACILGTGSNSCSYDGKEVIDNITNLGYLVGDEGSGSFLGKMLLRSYYYREMPFDLKEAFEEHFPKRERDIIKHIYDLEAPNVYLASFARFMSDYKKHFFVQNLVYKGFSEFIDRNVRKYHGHLNVPIHFIGSVAYHFSDILKIAMEKRRLVLGRIIKKPIDSLLEFHNSTQKV